MEERLFQANSKYLVRNLVTSRVQSSKIRVATLEKFNSIFHKSYFIIKIQTVSPSIDQSNQKMILPYLVTVVTFLLASGAYAQGGPGGGGGGNMLGSGQEAVVTPKFVHSSDKKSPPKLMHHIWWQGQQHLLESAATASESAVRNTPDWLAQFMPRWIKSWSIHHPSWQHQMWDEVSILALAKETGYSDLFEKLPEKIKKIDAARYLILLARGGVILDVDFEAFKSIDSLLQGHSAVLIEESSDQSINCAFMASVPQHPLWTRVLNEISKRQDKHPSRIEMYTTGHKMLTYVSEVWERSRWEMEFDDNDDNDVYILRHASEDNRLFYPYHADHVAEGGDNRELYSSSCSERNDCAATYPNSYAMRHFAAAWYDEHARNIGL